MEDSNSRCFNWKYQIISLIYMIINIIYTKNFNKIKIFNIKQIVLNFKCALDSYMLGLSIRFFSTSTILRVLTTQKESQYACQLIAIMLMMHSQKRASQCFYNWRKKIR